MRDSNNFNINLLLFAVLNLRRGAGKEYYGRGGPSPSFPDKGKSLLGVPSVCDLTRAKVKSLTWHGSNQSFYNRFSPLVVSYKEAMLHVPVVLQSHCQDLEVDHLVSSCKHLLLSDEAKGLDGLPTSTTGQLLGGGVSVPLVIYLSPVATIGA